VNVFFDVQGTLLDGDVPRPYAREIFIELASLGHDIYLWSSTGVGYAAMAAELLGVEDLVFGCYSKSVPPPVIVDYAVDDYPDLVKYYGGLVVVPFQGDPEDQELLKVPKMVLDRSH
jgi:hypothetical protein